MAVWRFHRRAAAADALRVSENDQLKQAQQAAEAEAAAWRAEVERATASLRDTYAAHAAAVDEARKKLAAAAASVVKGRLLRAGLTVYDDHIRISGNRHWLSADVSATVDSAGNLSRTRRHTLTRFALLGPLSLFTPKSTKHDDRELFMLIEARDWAQVVQCPPNAQAAARHLAQVICLTARTAEATQRARSERVEAAKRELAGVRADRAAIEAARAGLRDAHSEHTALEEALTQLESVVAQVEQPDARLLAALPPSLEGPSHAARRAAEVSERYRLELAAGPTDPGPQSGRIPGLPMLLPAKEGADADYRPPCGRGGPADPDASREDAGRVPASDRESAPESVGTSPGRVDVVDQLRGLGELQTAGVISEEEFETAKRQLLARL